MANEKNMPEKKFSTGAITATVWKNKTKTKEGDETEFRKVTFDRRYKDKDGEWQSTNNLRLNDLPKAVIVLQKAYEYILFRASNEA